MIVHAHVYEIARDNSDNNNNNNGTANNNNNINNGTITNNLNGRKIMFFKLAMRSDIGCIITGADATLHAQLLAQYMESLQPQQQQQPQQLQQPYLLQSSQIPLRPLSMYSSGGCLTIRDASFESSDCLIFNSVNTRDLVLDNCTLAEHLPLPLESCRDLKRISFIRCTFLNTSAFFTNLSLHGHVLTFLDINKCKLNNVQSLLVNKVKVLSIIETNARAFIKNLRMAPNYQITSLVLEFTKLTHVPRELFEIPTLVSLRLDNNSLTQIPECVTSLSLEILSIRSNRLKKIPDLRGLCKLTNLCLDFNRIIHIPDYIIYLTNLTYLYLTYNKLIAIPSSLQHLKLRGFKVSNNNLAYVSETLNTAPNAQRWIKEIQEELAWQRYVYRPQFDILES